MMVRDKKIKILKIKECFFFCPFFHDEFRRSIRLLTPFHRINAEELYQRIGVGKLITAELNRQQYFNSSDF